MHPTLRLLSLPLSLALVACEPAPTASESDAAANVEQSTASLSAALGALDVVLGGGNGSGLSPQQDRPSGGDDGPLTPREDVPPPTGLGDGGRVACSGGTIEKAMLCGEEYPSRLAWEWNACTTPEGGVSTGAIALDSSFGLTPSTATCESFDGVDWSATLSYGVVVDEADGTRNDRSGSLAFGAAFDSEGQTTSGDFMLAFANLRTLGTGEVVEDNEIDGSLKLDWDDPVTELRVSGGYAFDDRVAGKRSSATLTDAAFVPSCCAPIRGNATIQLEDGSTVAAQFGPACGQVLINGIVPFTIACSE